MSLDPWTGPWTERMLDRVMQDELMMRTPDRWPLRILLLKTQPWITERDGRMRTAVLNVAGEPIIQLDDGLSDEGQEVRYASLHELARYWSVD